VAKRKHIERANQLKIAAKPASKSRTQAEHNGVKSYLKENSALQAPLFSQNNKQTTILQNQFF
jgi:hypothetical protein